MRGRIYFYGGLLLVALFLAFAIKNPVFLIPAPPEFQKADPERLQTIVRRLAGAVPPRNFSHPEALREASEYIAGEFGKSGLSPRLQEFQVRGVAYRNVIADLGPAEGDLLVIGAHYDACDEFPGADDNASGTAGVVELARILSPLKGQLKRPIELVAFALEEPPNFGSDAMGSYAHAQSLRAANKKVELMISLEMIGYFSDAPGSQKYLLPLFSLLYPSVGNYVALIARPQEWLITRDVKALFASATDLPVQSANAPRLVPGVDLSDHMNYWSAGYPAMMVTDTAFMRNLNYHQAGDRPETLNYQKMAEVVNGVAAIAIGI